MLAYVFWHWPQAVGSTAQYEDALRSFHAALRGQPSRGFERSTVTAIIGAAWIPAGRESYEDWYLLEDSSALDALNDAAISAGRQQPHDAVASMADGGTAGLYRLRQGRPLECPSQAWWFAKPQGMSYVTLFGLLASATHGSESALWCRQMVLGPTPEFCLHVSATFTPPTAIASSAVLVQHRRVWPDAPDRA